MSKWVFLSFAIFSEVVATASLKSTEGFTRWGPSLIVLVGYCAAFYFLSLTLDTIPVGVAYAIWSGVGVATITIVSYFLYDQKIDTAGIVGISLIVIGVVILRFMSETGELAGCFYLSSKLSSYVNETKLRYYFSEKMTLNKHTVIYGCTRM